MAGCWVSGPFESYSVHNLNFDARRLKSSPFSGLF